MTHHHSILTLIKKTCDNKVKARINLGDSSLHNSEMPVQGKLCKYINTTYISLKYKRPFRALQKVGPHSATALDQPCWKATKAEEGKVEEERIK
jgi:hypothetical protein